MNSLTVDGSSLIPSDINGNNLEEILSSLMDHPQISNRVITSVLLNGSPYSEEIPHAALEVERDEIDSLELLTHSAEDLSLHFMEHGHQQISALQNALPKIVDEFRLGDEMEANEHFLAFLESFHLIICMLEQSKLAMGLSDDIEVAEHGSINTFLNHLGETLTNMVGLQEQSDWIYLADVLEYELDGLLTDLKEFLPQLRKASH